jgi:hypothetical protein
MRRIKLLVLAAFAILALGAVASAVAGAEVTALLTLEGPITKLEGNFKGGASELEALNKLGLKDTAVTATIKGCTEAGSTTDTIRCTEGLITLTGVTTSTGTSCRSENLAGTKDAIGTVLVKVAYDIASEESQAKTLQPLLITQLLGVDGDKDVIVNCAGVKNLLLGEIGCLVSPGLEEVKAGGIFRVECKQKGGDQETGIKCVEPKAACELLAANPFGANLNGTEEMAGIKMSLEGTFNKDVLLDD